ncbi:uncharacterized protein LOC107632663 [Arachis ipaensis]|uniref:uncharacterized protein LOC107632663 n=1 Tax=Arachis ipaensis TaxID=130454 RepID=UPI0007AF1A89|nr:uncharacterized protein LOC107632663 [Arachis ipaensis]
MNLLSSSEYQGPEQVFGGNEKDINIANIGRSIMHASMSNKFFKLQNLLHESKRILLQGKLKNGLYRFIDIQIPSQIWKQNKALATQALDAEQKKKINVNIVTVDRKAQNNNEKAASNNNMTRESQKEKRTKRKIPKHSSSYQVANISGLCSTISNANDTNANAYSLCNKVENSDVSVPSNVVHLNVNVQFTPISSNKSATIIVCHSPAHYNTHSTCVPANKSTDITLTTNYNVNPVTMNLSFLIVPLKVDSFETDPLQVEIGPRVQPAADTTAPVLQSRLNSIVQNTHHMQTRSKSGITKSRVLTATLSSTNLTNNLPKSITQALATPHWRDAMEKEYSALMKNNTWRLIDPPPRSAPIGCKWAPRAWFTRLSSALRKFGFVITKSNVSLFTRFTSSSVIYILVYVDDILVTGNSESEINSIMTQLHSTFSLKVLGEMNYFLGIEVKHSNNGTVTLKQTKYIQDLLEKAEMSNAKPVPTPMTSSLKLSAFNDGSFNNSTLYRSIVGGLQYATITRPKISFFG